MLIVLALIFWGSFLLLFWTYFGYPMMMFLWAKIRPLSFHKQDIIPSLTMLIPAYNEADVIRKKLDNAVSLDYPKDKLEILVVDDGSTDGTAGIVREFEDRGVKLIQQTQRGGKISGVNRGMAEAAGDIVVLSDASPIYKQDSLQTLVRGFADSKVGVIVGTLAVWDTVAGVAKQAGLYWRYEAALRRWESTTGSTVAVHGNMFAVRRDLYRPLPSTTINDEFSIAMEVMRQGYRVVYEPDAISYDDASASMGDEFKRRVRINAGRYQALFASGYLRAPNLNLAFRLFSHKLLRPLVPIFMVLMLIVNGLAALWSAFRSTDTWFLQFWVWAILLAGQVAFYGLAWLGYRAELRGKRNKLLAIPYFFVSTNLAALVGLWRWLRGKQRVTWQKRSAGQQAP
jgi:cellulose synthase/poly-beta-1,6-N-acetylglucosamine synthase-like glycosyltransferase